MNTTRAWWAAVAILVMLCLLPAAAVAQDENQAGLVIQFADGQSQTWCAAFEGETISGDELLARSELEILIDPSSGMGITVCRIEGLGCDYPAEHCFCECMGGESCAYWNYFYRDPGDETWTYSALGALLREVPPGGMEAWVWGDGKTPPAAGLTFEAVCAPPTPTPEPAATETPTPLVTETPVVVTNTAAPGGTATQVALEPTDTPAPVSPVEAVSNQNGTGSGGSSYVWFGLIVVVLAAAGVVALLRQRRVRRA